MAIRKNIEKKPVAKAAAPKASDAAPRTAKRVVNFQLEDAPGKQVFVAGNFNDWQPVTPMPDKKGIGVYACQVRLEPGEYQYKFVVDGEWRLDNSNSSFVPNGFGELNSVLKVEKKEK